MALIVGSLAMAIFLLVFPIIFRRQIKPKGSATFCASIDIAFAWLDLGFDALFARKAYEVGSSVAWPSATIVLAAYGVLSFCFLLWILIAITCPLLKKRDGSVVRCTLADLTDLSNHIDTHSLVRNGPFLAVICVLSVTNVELVKVLPWTTNSDYEHYDGFPTRWVLGMVMLITLSEDLPQLVITVLFLNENHELSSNLVAWINLAVTVASLLYRTFKRILRCAPADAERRRGPLQGAPTVAEGVVMAEVLEER